jgi:hypothetical protein
MRVDAAGQHPPSGRVDRLVAGEPARERCNAPTGDADVAFEHVGCGGDACVRNNGVEAHGTSRKSRPHRSMRRGSVLASFSDFHTTVAIVS